MDIETTKIDRVEYRARPKTGMEIVAVIEGSTIQDGRLTFFYSDAQGAGSLTVPQSEMLSIVEFINRLQHAEAIRLGLIPSEPPKEETPVENPEEPVEEPPTEETPVPETEPIEETPVDTEVPEEAEPTPTPEVEDTEPTPTPEVEDTEPTPVTPSEETEPTTEEVYPTRRSLRESS